MTTKDLKANRVAAKITRGQLPRRLASASSNWIELERGVDVDEAVRKAYDDGLAKLLAEAAKASTTTSTKPKATAKKTTARKVNAQGRGPGGMTGLN